MDMSADGTTIALGVNGGKIWISSDGGSTFTEVGTCQSIVANKCRLEKKESFMKI